MDVMEVAGQKTQLLVLSLNTATPLVATSRWRVGTSRVGRGEAAGGDPRPDPDLGPALL